MFNPTRKALYVAICAMGLVAANEASAGCKLINGAKVCASWITGSEICQVAVDSSQIDNPTTATCIVRGFGGGDGTESNPFTCNDGTLTGAQTCTVSSGDASIFAGAGGGNGVAWAGGNPARQGPKCVHDKFNPPKNPACVNGTPDLGGDILTSPTVPLSCNGNGICTATAEVGVPDGATCSNFQDLLDFTADSFLGILVIGTSDGDQLFAQQCILDSTGHSYTCTDPTEFVDPACQFPPSD